MALEPRRYDRILNEAPDDVLGAIFGFLLFESSTAAKDDDGVRAPLPPLLPQSPAAAALGLPEHADLAKTRERADVASILVARGLSPMDRRGPGLPGWRGFDGLEVLGAFANIRRRPGVAPPPPWAEPPPRTSSPETLLDDVPGAEGF